jgi:hypothetical protein
MFFSTSDKLAELKEDCAFLLALELIQPPPPPPSIPLLANKTTPVPATQREVRPSVGVRQQLSLQ